MLIYTPKVPPILSCVANYSELIEHWGFDLNGQAHPLSSLQILNMTQSLFLNILTFVHLLNRTTCCLVKVAQCSSPTNVFSGLNQSSSNSTQAVMWILFLQEGKELMTQGTFISHYSRLQSRCWRLVIRNWKEVMLSKWNILSCKCSNNVQSDTCSCFKAGYDTQVRAKASSIPHTVTSQLYWLTWSTL